MVKYSLRQDFSNQCLYILDWPNAWISMLFCLIRSEKSFITERYDSLSSEELNPFPAITICSDTLPDNSKQSYIETIPYHFRLSPSFYVAKYENILCIFWKFHKLLKEINFCHKLWFSNPYILQPNVVNFWYFKLWTLQNQIIKF